MTAAVRTASANAPDRLWGSQTEPVRPNHRFSATEADRSGHTPTASRVVQPRTASYEASGVRKVSASARGGVRK